MSPRTQTSKLRHFCRILLFLPLFGLVCAGCLLLIGVPGSWISAGLERWGNVPVRVEMEELSYHPFRGFHILNVRMYVARDLVSPVFQADEVTYDPRRLRKFWRDDWRGSLEVVNARLQTELGMWADDLQTRRLFTFEEIHGRFLIEKDRIRIPSGTGLLSGMKLQVTGEMMKPDPTSREKGALAQKKIKRIAENVAAILDFLEAFDFESPPEVKVVLGPAGGENRGGTVEVNVDHREVARHRGFSFEAFKLAARYQEKILEVEEFRVRENEQRQISGNARVDFEKDMFTLELDNQLRRYALEALCPFPLRSFLDRLQLRLEDQVDFQLRLGPNSFAKPGERVSGTFLVRNGFYRDAFFQELALVVDRNGPRLELRDIRGQVGQGDGAGRVEGDVLLDFDTGKVDVGLKGAFYPDMAMSLVPARAEGLLREWEFRGKPPEFELDLTKASRSGPLVFTIDLDAEALLWKGTLFDQFRARIEFDKEGLTVRDLLAGRGEERLQGWLSFPPDFSGTTLELTSNFHLPDLLPLAGESVVEFARPVRFRGDSRFDMKGRLNFKQPDQNELEGSASFTNVVLEWLLFDEIGSTFSLKGETLTLPDVKGVLVDGKLEAVFTATDMFSDEAAFDLNLRVDQVDLFEVITKATDTEDTPYSGHLELRLELAGAMKDRETVSRFDTLTGNGRVTIEGGTLFRIPLLLGLSQILNNVVRGFGYASQGDFSADFEVGEGFVSSKSLFLKGNLLSIGGDGWYRFEDQRIAASLKVQLFSEGILSEALKVVLWPIRKLIEVQLKGTLDQPEWQPRNLPRELFGK
ncbi:MAG: AsmA-like C-terminal region-containing protein [Kiritimatiellia bacterium]